MAAQGQPIDFFKAQYKSCVWLQWDSGENAPNQRPNRVEHKGKKIHGQDSSAAPRKTAMLARAQKGVSFAQK